MHSARGSLTKRRFTSLEFSWRFFSIRNCREDSQEFGSSARSY